MKASRWILLFSPIGAAFAACGPDHKPDEPCDGPSFNLVVRAETDWLPSNTRLNVRYGGNQEGEPYQLGESRTPQAVFCSEDTNLGGAPAAEDEPLAGAGGAPSGSESTAVHKLRCRLYTQGPARLDVTATGIEPIQDHSLSFEYAPRHCQVPVDIVLQPLVPDGGT